MTVVTGALLHRRVTDQAERRGGARAVILGQQQLTYEALEAASDRLARQLSELGVTDGDRVALIGPKQPTTIAAMLACLKLGALYVPIDAATPPARIALILRAADPRAVVSTASSVKLLDALAESGVLGSSPLVSLDDEIVSDRVRSSASSIDWTSLDATPFGIDVDDDHGAHILFTSGSTGVPKGVVITHANVVGFVDWAVSYFGIAARRRFDPAQGPPRSAVVMSTISPMGGATSGPSVAQRLLHDASGKARELMVRSPRVRRLVYSVRNRRLFADLAQHDRMLADSVRIEAYYDALSAHIRPGDVVVDLGTGSGVLGFFAARLGAARVTRSSTARSSRRHRRSRWPTASTTSCSTGCTAATSNCRSGPT